MQRTKGYSVPTPTGHIYNTTVTPTSQEYGAGWGGGQNDSKSQRTRMFSVREYFLYTTGAEPIKSEEYGHLNKASTMTAPVDMPTQMEEIS